ncbi:EpsG family protein [Flavobacterium flavigenum]|uniref:EpsG family protein n=1 Tax=Flavobacterium flavigenum TaxID=3003258 RepID=UPI002482C574|nr:EpsG family protein [Flavobacterium flavigenum]
MFFYILLVIVVLVLLLFSYRYPNAEKTISLILLTILVLIGGFRDRIGCDYDNYVDWYIRGSRDDNFEFGFLGIMKVFRYLNLDYHFLFFFFSFFNYILVYLGIKKYTDKINLPLVLFVFIPVLFIFSLNGIRQSLSVAISFFAMSYLLNKKYISFILLMSIGISIHYSCLLPFVVFFLVFKFGSFIKTRELYLLIVVSFLIGQIGVIYWLSLFFKNSHYLFYVSDKFTVPVPLAKLIVMNLMGLIVISFYEKHGFQYDQQKNLLLVYISSIFFLNLFSESIDLTRLYIYFRIFEIILVAEIIRSSIENRKLWLIGFICCFYILPFFRAIKIDSEGVNSTLIPYRNYLFRENLDKY